MCEAAHMAPRVPRAWLVMAVGNDRQHGGNSGYDDQVDVYYSWDSTVPNHRRVSAGDVVALWDKKRMLGVSVIEDVVSEPGRKKLLFRCPVCGRASFKARSRKTPRYLCNTCKAEFDMPITETATVTTYRSRHDAAWTPLEGLLDGDELRRLCVSPGSQLSMRQLDWTAFSAALTQRGAERAIERVSSRAPDLMYPSRRGMAEAEFSQGHVEAFVRVRRGQQQFRQRLLRTQGSVCAFTGSAPERVLEAGHLYSYASLGQHRDHGGLMLRRDVHRLFDDGWLAVSPSSLRIHVSSELKSFTQYAQLDGEQLTTKVSGGQRSWLEKHWAEHRRV